MAVKHSRIIVRLALLAILVVALAVFLARYMASSTVRVENASGTELTDVELRFTVAGTPVPHTIGRLAPDERRTVTLDVGSGDFPLAATYRTGAVKIKCDLGVSIHGRGERLVLRISQDKYEIVPE